MARIRARSRGTGISLDIDVDAARTQQGFREVRREIGRAFDQIVTEAAERVVLPDAKRRAGNLKVEGDSTAGALLVRKRRSAPYLTTKFRGRKARAAGLQEFGGVVRTDIMPRKKRAVVVNGQPVARVTKARHYRAHHFLLDAVDAKVGEFGDRARDDLVEIFARNGFEVR